MSSSVMKVDVTSRETIRPDSNEVHLQKPFQLSFLDQLMPSNYVPAIFFYHFESTAADHQPSQISSQLKKSLSKTLSEFYPLSGRTVDNNVIDSYEEGIPYIEARVSGGLPDYLDETEIEKLNHLLPVEPFCPASGSFPLLAVQFNMFECGGIALALCGSHKIVDLSTMSAFLKSWTSFSRGSDAAAVHISIPRPHLLEASPRIFPPKDEISPHTHSEGNYKTRSFVFDADAVKTLASQAKGENLDRPSRAETLTAFIWKHAMLASRSVYGTAKPSVVTQAVGLRQRLKPQLPEYSIGNINWLAITYYNYSSEKEIKLDELAFMLRQSVENMDIEALQGDEGFEVINENINQVAEFTRDGNADFFSFTSWLNSGLHQHDFGWGKPKYVCMPGLEAPAFNNAIVFKDFGHENAIQAWVTLDQKYMDVLEQDPDFLAFASPNPYHP